VPGVDFDAGLLNADGSPRPSYRVIAAAVGPRRRSGRAVGENEVAPLLRLSGHDPVSFARGRALLVRLACVSASVAAPCSGSVRVSAAGRLITAPARVRAAATGRVTLRLSSGVAAVLRRERRPRVRLSICTRGRCGPATVARVSRG
jgi:hypothetical protein